MIRMGTRLSSGSRCPQSPKGLPLHLLNHSFLRGRPVLAFFARACPELAERAGSDAAEGPSASSDLTLLELPSRVADRGASTFRTAFANVLTILGEVHSASAVVFSLQATARALQVFRWSFLWHPVIL
jgi:hypothetical protein